MPYHNNFELFFARTICEKKNERECDKDGCVCVGVDRLLTPTGGCRVRMRAAFSSSNVNNLRWGCNPRPFTRAFRNER